MTTSRTTTDMHLYTVITRTSSKVTRFSDTFDDLMEAIEYAESERMDPDSISVTILMDGFPVL